MIGRHVLATGTQVEFDGTSAPLTPLSSAPVPRHTRGKAMSGRRMRSCSAVG
jgi:hypothetical protein